VEYYTDKIFESSIYMNKTGKGAVTKQHSLRQLSLAFVNDFGNRSFLAVWNSAFQKDLWLKGKVLPKSSNKLSVQFVSVIHVIVEPNKLESLTF